TNYYNVPHNTEPALNVKKYGSVILKDVWSGVDLRYYSRGGVLESDWLMERAEDYTQIAFEVAGTDMYVDGDGYLVMPTPYGEIREGGLKVYQGDVELTAEWVVEGNRVSFKVEGYNPKLPMRIDPPTLYKCAW